MGKLRIQRRAGVKPNVSFSLDDRIVAANNDDNSTVTKQQIPKEHKFVVSGVAAQSLAVLSHTAGDKVWIIALLHDLHFPSLFCQCIDCHLIMVGRVAEHETQLQ